MYTVYMYNDIYIYIYGMINIHITSVFCKCKTARLPNCNRKDFVTFSTGQLLENSPFSEVLTIHFTIWLFNIAMENDPFIDNFPIKTTIYSGFFMAMLNNQMVAFQNFARDGKGHEDLSLSGFSDVFCVLISCFDRMMIDFMKERSGKMEQKGLLNWQVVPLKQELLIPQTPWELWNH